MSGSSQSWDTSYEWKTVLLLGLGFCLVGLDRWIIAPLFPCMVATGIAPRCGTAGLGLDYQAIGTLVGVLGIVWGIFAAISGRLSDGIGHRKILIPAILLFSLMSGVSGMVTGLGSLIAAFTQPSLGTYSPIGANNVLAPGLVQIDMGLTRTFNIYER